MAKIESNITPAQGFSDLLSRSAQACKDPNLATGAQSNFVVETPLYTQTNNASQFCGHVRTIVNHSADLVISAAQMFADTDAAIADDILKTL